MAQAAAVATRFAAVGRLHVRSGRLAGLRCVASAWAGDQARLPDSQRPALR